MRIVKADSPQLLEAVYRMRYEMMVEELHELSEEKFSEKMEMDEYDRYAQQYLFISKKGDEMGCFRLIFRTPIGIPAIKIYDLDDMVSQIGLENICEMSRIYIKKEFRAISTTLDLFTRIIVFGCIFMKREKMTHAICAVEEPLYRLIRLSNAPFRKIGKARPNYVRPRYPLLLSMKELAEREPKYCRY